MDSTILSIVIISHNQKEKLKRCIDSILAQKTIFKKEVIVSDDCSDDGTREMLLNDYNDRVISTFFNSNEYDTSYTLEKAALNRINGIKKATGKYLIHVDGDDFFTGTDVFQRMVDTLENHPECTLCCQNYFQLPYDNLSLKCKPARNQELFKGERILSAEEFMKESVIGHNSSYCLRRTDCVKIEKLTSATYDDIDITFRYLGSGKIALIDKCDFVYVLYPVSSSTSMTIKEKYIMYNTYITGIPLAPAIAGVLLKNHLNSIARISLEGMKNSCYPERMVKFCRKLNLRILEGFNEKMKLVDRFKYGLLFILAATFIVLPFKTKGMIKLVYRLAINKRIEDTVVI